MEFERRLQILGFSNLRKYDSQTTNKPIHLINLYARRNGVEPPELLMFDILQLCILWCIVMFIMVE